MTIQDLGAIGEIVGAIAVVASLLYLAFQIRTSNRMAQQAEIKEVLELTLDFVAQLSLNEEVTELWLRGHADNDARSDVERTRFRFLLYQVTGIWQRMWMLKKTGSLPPEYWESGIKLRRNMMSSPGFKSWFDDTKHTLPDNWRKFLESEYTHVSGVYHPQGVKSKEHVQSDT